MDWTDEDVEDVETAGGEGGTRAAMTRAVELAAARGGTMTAEDLEAWLVAIERERGSIAPIRQHISALGARNAVLEAEREDYRNKMELQHQEWRRMMDAEAKEAERANGDDGEEMVSCDECEARKPLSQMRSLEEGGWVCSAHVTNAHLCRNCEGIQPETCLFNPERVKERSEAVNTAIRMTIKDNRGNVVSDGMISLDDDVDDSGHSEDFEQVAEAMRAACWESVQTQLIVEGISEKSITWSNIKAAIEGAAP